MITLYDYWRSSASYRVRIALNLANEPWRSVSVDLRDGAQRSPDHLARNPQGLVPTLEIDGQLFTQSLAIIEYLDETRGLGLLPDTALDRARVRALAHSIAMDLHPVCNLRVVNYATEQSGDTIISKDWMQHFIHQGLAAYEDMVTPGAFSFGANVTLADLCLMPQLYNAHRWEVDLSAMPKLGKIEKNLTRIPAFAHAAPAQ